MLTFFEIGRNNFLFTPGAREGVQFQFSKNSLTLLISLRPHHFAILRFYSTVAPPPPMSLDPHTLTRVVNKNRNEICFHNVQNEAFPNV